MCHCAAHKAMQPDACSGERSSPAHARLIASTLSGAMTDDSARPADWRAHRGVGTLEGTPMPPSPFAPRSDRPLFERLFTNYLAFLARHRDTVERKDGRVLVDSTSPE